VVFVIIAALNLRLMLSCLIHLKDFLHIDPSTTFNATQRDAATAESELKHILLYTKYWGEEGFQFGTDGQEPFFDRIAAIFIQTHFKQCMNANEEK